MLFIKIFRGKKLVVQLSKSPPPPPKIVIIKTQNQRLHTPSVIIVSAIAHWITDGILKRINEWETKCFEKETHFLGGEGGVDMKDQVTFSRNQIPKLSV